LTIDICCGTLDKHSREASAMIKYFFKKYMKKLLT